MSQTARNPLDLNIVFLALAGTVILANAIDLLRFLLVWPAYSWPAVIDAGFDTSMARYFAEHHFVAFWDHLNFGPGGRPNLRGPLLHVLIGLLGKAMGGRGDDYVFSSATFMALQWFAAVLTVFYFSRRLGGELSGLIGVLLFTAWDGGKDFYVGMPAGWTLILTPWAISLFLQNRLWSAAVIAAASIYFHLAAFLTVPLALLIAAVLSRKTKQLLFTASLFTALTAPYLFHILIHINWFRFVVPHPRMINPLSLPLGLVGLGAAATRWRQNTLLLATAAGQTPWLLHDLNRLLTVSHFPACLLGAIFLATVLGQDVISGGRRHYLLFAVVVLGVYGSVILPWITVTAISANSMPWEESKRVASIIGTSRFADRLVSVYDPFWGSSLATFSHIVQEKGFWMEVAPAVDDADSIPIDKKLWVFPMTRGDSMLERAEHEGFLAVVDSTERNSVVCFRQEPPLDYVILMMSTAGDDAAWLSKHVVPNTYIERSSPFFFKAGPSVSDLRAQRNHLARIQLAVLLYSFALKRNYKEIAEQLRYAAYGYGQLAALAGDRHMTGVGSADSYRLLRRNLATFAARTHDLQHSRLPTPELMICMLRLFDDFFESRLTSQSGLAAQSWLSGE